MGNPNAPQPDVSLWIIHYGPADPADRIPINMIPFDERVSQTLSTRHHLLRMGQIQRKDFMLSDRVNWPQLQFPREGGGRHQAAYGAPPSQRGVPQQMAYPPHQPAGPPSKRARHAQPVPNQAPPQMGGMPHMDAAYDDDEDVSKGDMFDAYTLRDIALSRYQINHEWMDEITGSVYAAQQLKPSDLGLGFLGQLSSVTEGIFSAPGADVLSKTPDVGKLDPKMAEQFRQRVADHIKSETEEIQKMKEQHAKELAKMKATSIFTTAERELRTAVWADGTDTWQLEGRQEDGEEVGGVRAKKHAKTVDEIVAETNAHVGRDVDEFPDVKRVQDGGYQSPAPEPVPEPVAESAAEAAPAAEANAPMSRQPSQAGSQHSGVMIGDSDIDMGGTAAGLLDQMHGGFSSTSTPVNNFPTPQPHLSAVQSTAATPANLNAPSPTAAPVAREATPAAQPGAAQEDVDMGNTEPAKEPTGPAPDQDAGSGDWVVVPKGGVSPEPQGSTPAAAPSSAAEPAKPAAAPAAPKPASAAATPAVTDAGSAAFDQNDFSSLGDLDTAGDALAGYEGSGLDGSTGELGDGLDLNMELEDSAFGDAFHGVSTPADNQGI